MSPELTQAVLLCRNLPTPAGIAMRIIALAQDPDAELGTAAELIAMDPALSARILRLANSPLFANRRRIDNLQQAINKLGLHPTLQIALGFSLLSNLRGDTSLHSTHERIWRRSLIAAVAARALGEALNLQQPDALLLAGLLQDIGGLFLMQSQPELYQSLSTQAAGDNQRLLALENTHFGTDHAAIGAELARQWNLPAYLVDAIAGSETPPTPATDTFLRCVHASGSLADIWLDGPGAQPAQQRLAAACGLDQETLTEVFARVAQLLPDAASVFETVLPTPEHVAALLQQAREIHELRQLRQSQLAEEALQQRSEALERQAMELSTMASRDSLTGTINRGHFDKILLTAFDHAIQRQQPLSVAFIDLDDFKKINDRHGHLIGDDVLKSVAQHLKSRVRTVDTVARFGGEEFVIIFPDTALDSAKATIDRVLHSLSAQPVAEIDGQMLHVTFSAGIACHQPLQPFNSARSLLDAADRALYQSKDRGRNRVVVHVQEHIPVPQA